MKLLLPFLLTLVIGCVYGLPSHYNNAWTPCSDASSLQTLWPDFNNNRIFLQCMSVGVWGIHSCPAELQFSFWLQVCVWPRLWVAPPPPDQITPFPTTLWPGPTEEQEVTIPTNPPTNPPTTIPPVQTTVPPADTTLPGDTTIPIPTVPEATTTIAIDTQPPIDPGTTTDPEDEPTTIAIETQPPIEPTEPAETVDPDFTPPTPQPTTDDGVHPPTPEPTQPGETRPPIADDPNITPPTPQPRTTVGPEETPPTQPVMPMVVTPSHWFPKWFLRGF